MTDLIVVLKICQSTGANVRRRCKLLKNALLRRRIYLFVQFMHFNSSLLKIFRYKPKEIAVSDDPMPDYMNLLAMIFSMCGLLLKVSASCRQF